MYALYMKNMTENLCFLEQGIVAPHTGNMLKLVVRHPIWSLHQRHLSNQVELTYRKSNSRLWNVHSRVVEHLRTVILPQQSTENTFYTVNKNSTTGYWDILKNSEVQELALKLEQILSKKTYKNLSTLRLYVSKLCQMMHTHNMTLADMLLIQDMFIIFEHNSTLYTKSMIQYLASHPDIIHRHLTPPLFLQLTLYLGTFRDAHPVLLHELEKYLDIHVQQFTARELSVICHSFYSVNRSLRSYTTLHHIAWTVCQQLDSMEATLLANVFKALKHSRFDEVKFFNTIGDKLCTWSALQTTKSFPNIWHIAQCFTTAKVAHMQLFEIIDQVACSLFDRAKREGLTLRLKDMLLLACYSSLHLPPPKLLGILNQLITKNSTQWPIDNLANIEFLLALAYYHIYPTLLISATLHMKNVQRNIDSKLPQDFQLLLLDSIVRHEVKRYTGNLLSTDSKALLLQSMKKNLDMELRRKGLPELYYHIMKMFGGSHEVKLCYSQTFSRVAGIEIHLRTNGSIKQSEHQNNFNEDDLIYAKQKAIESHSMQTNSTKSIIDQVLEELNIPPEFSHREELLTQVHKCNSTQHNKVCIRQMGYNQYIQNQPKLTGFAQLETRLLQAQGYDVVLISPYQGVQFSGMSSAEKDLFVENEIVSPLNLKLFFEHHAKPKRRRSNVKVDKYFNDR